MCCLVILPIERLRQDTIRDNSIRLIGFRFCEQLIRFLPITSPVCQLKIRKIGRMTASDNWYDMIHAGRHRMRIFQTKVNRIAANSAHRLCDIYLLFVLSKRRSVLALFVGSVCPCRYLHPLSTISLCIIVRPVLLFWSRYCPVQNRIWLCTGGMCPDCRESVETPFLPKCNQSISRAYR